MTTRYRVELPYTRAELLALFAMAEREDVEHGGRYDKRSACLIIWSHSWINEATRHDSEPIGSFYIEWGDTSRVYLIECEEGFEQDDLLHELGILEQKALGRVKHGNR
jgi:hypothetical protein